jgi:hypothetical protein
MPSHLEYEACKNIAKLDLQQCCKASLETNVAKEHVLQQLQSLPCKQCCKACSSTVLQNMSCNNIFKLVLQKCCKACLSTILRNEFLKAWLASMLQSLSFNKCCQACFLQR